MKDVDVMEKSLSRETGEGGELRSSEPGGGCIQLQAAPSLALPRIRGRGNERRIGWESNLDQLIKDWQSRPFVWGQTDCAQFALAVLKAISVRDWAQISVQPYKTARAAHALLQRLGAEDMPALADKMLGPRVPVSYAQRGDIVSAACRFGPALGVCLGARIALPGEDGLVYRPLSSAFAAWRI